MALSGPWIDIKVTGHPDLCRSTVESDGNNNMGVAHNSNHSSNDGYTRLMVAKLFNGLEYKARKP
jgi:hypothetical protein